MKKLKAIICTLMAAVMAFAIVGVAGCGNNNGNTDSGNNGNTDSGNDDTHSHTYADTWTTNETQHWKVATCEHTDEISQLGEHDYDSDYVCTVCGYQHDHTFTSENNYTCSCGLKHVHEYSSAWTSDEISHWHASECGHDVITGNAPHRYNANYVCTTCGYQHEHTYSQEWSFDANKHWHADTCGHKTISDEADHNWNESYVCTDCGYTMANAGISISKTTTEYTLSTKKPTVDIPVSDITVKLARVNESLVQEITDYSLEYYKGGEKLEDLNGLGGGAYNIWAKATIDIEGQPVECESFIIVYVIDDLKSLSFNKTAEGVVTTQGQSVIDRMTDTWSFTATYNSGKTETVYADDVLITGLDTNKVTASAAATITYTAYNSKGEATSKQATVGYSITEAQNTVVTSAYDFDALKATLSATDQAAGTVVLPVGELGGNSFLNVLSENTTWYRGPSNNLLEIQHDALKVNMTGVGTISMSVDSTSSTNISSIALKDSEGNFVAGTIGASNIAKDDEENAYCITGKGGQITFVILKPGEYTICTVDDVTVSGEVKDTNRHTRILSLIVVDEQVEIS